MNDEVSKDRERDFGQRIAKSIQSIGQAPEKQITADEQQKLKAAADRLDQMLKAASDVEQQSLKDAAGKLDRLLADIRKGKDVSNKLKRRGNRHE